MAATSSTAAPLPAATGPVSGGELKRRVLDKVLKRDDGDFCTLLYDAQGGGSYAQQWKMPPLTAQQIGRVINEVLTDDQVVIVEKELDAQVDWEAGQPARDAEDAERAAKWDAELAAAAAARALMSLGSGSILK